ncbi:MAG: cellulase, glycosyl hydrolase family 5 [Mucilaginibacter sp.]|nr:cellulase, glycosyl hydrolase family 5 [Mucilaginibacter sp.]
MNKLFPRLLYLFISLLFTYFMANGQSDFVTVNRTDLLLYNKPYRFTVTNYGYGVLLDEVNAEAVKERLKKELDFLKSKGVINLRVFVGAEGIASNKFRVPYSIQPEEGKIDIKYLQSLDYFLNETGKRNMKSGLFLTNNWDWSGGLIEYLKWNGYGQPPSQQTAYGQATQDPQNGKSYWVSYVDTKALMQ